MLFTCPVPPPFSLLELGFAENPHCKLSTKASYPWPPPKPSMDEVYVTEKEGRKKKREDDEVKDPFLS